MPAALSAGIAPNPLITARPTFFTGHIFMQNRLGLILKKHSDFSHLTDLSARKFIIEGPTDGPTRPAPRRRKPTNHPLVVRRSVLTFQRAAVAVAGQGRGPVDVSRPGPARAGGAASTQPASDT